jgi:hypothetical protein
MLSTPGPSVHRYVAKYRTESIPLFLADSLKLAFVAILAVNEALKRQMFDPDGDEFRMADSRLGNSNS